VRSKSISIRKLELGGYVFGLVQPSGLIEDHFHICYEVIGKEFEVLQEIH
jgi:hypothetical protein